MKIKTPFNRGEFTPTNSGDKYRYNYKRVQDDNGGWHLVQTDKIDIMKEINSQIPPSILDIMARARRGDDTLLNARTGEVYEDISRIPSSFGDVLKLGVNTKSIIDFIHVPDDLAQVESEVIENG